MTRAVFASNLGRLFTILAPILILLSGCGHKADHDLSATQPPAVTEAVGKLEESFKSADPLNKKSIDASIAAVNARDYQKAADILQQLRTEPHLNYPQDTAVKNAINVFMDLSPEPAVKK